MRILSGIQPSGDLHLGNYFGSMRPNLEMVGEGEESIFFIADLHALTSIHDAQQLAKLKEDVLLDYLACGFDPSKATIFYQSDVPHHAELMWILSTVTPMGLLERAVSYKEKVQKGIAASVGLFTYPVLMAADILLYDATIVPVGKDQKQHVEMARDIAMKFNHHFGETLIVPEPKIKEEVAVVPGTDGQKMSKSYGNTIPLFGEEKNIQKAIMGMVTDSKGANDPKDPSTSPIFKLHSLFLSPAEAKTLAEAYRAGMSYGEAKKSLFAAYMDTFAAMRQKRAELAKKPKFVREIAQEGAQKATRMAAVTLERVKKAVGLI